MKTIRLKVFYDIGKHRSVLPKICIFLLTALVMGCGDSNPKFINSYKETPVFIKNFLDTTMSQKGWVAEKGENWNGGCVMQENIPSCQFISATVAKNQFKMSFWSGGIVVTKKILKVDFIDNKVIGYSIAD